MNPPLYRPALPEDHPHIVRFQLEMAYETERLRLDEETCSLGVAAVFEDSAKGRYFVVEEGGRVVGCLLVTFEWSDWRNGQVWWIQSLYLEPALRGRGVFSSFYDFVRDLAMAEGARGIRLYVDRTNLHAQKVYRAIGMSGEHYQLFEWMRGEGEEGKPSLSRSPGREAGQGPDQDQLSL